MRLPESVSSALLAALGVLLIVWLAAAWPLPIRAAVPLNADPEPNMGQGECITVIDLVNAAVDLSGVIGPVSYRLGPDPTFPHAWLMVFSSPAVSSTANYRLYDGCVIDAWQEPPARR